MIKHLLILLFAAPLAGMLFAQEDNISFHFNGYDLNAAYDTASYCSVLTITHNKKEIFRSECDDKISSIEARDLEGTGEKQIIIEHYTGGAHCCEYLVVYKLSNEKFLLQDTLYWGNTSYSIVDINKDGKLEIEGRNDMFAYAFTNFAQSAFSYSIYKFKNGKFYLANKEFKDRVEDHIKELKGYLNDYIKSGFECPKTANEDTFNTDAGAVKALLAPIVADYYSIGKMQEGYNYVDKVYKCSDKDKFIQILKTDYNLR